MGAVASDAAVDLEGTAAGCEVQRAVRLARDATSILCTGGDGACHIEVLDGGILDITEGCSTRDRRLIVNRQRVAVAVEDALERVGLAVAHHCRYGEVRGQFHMLVSEGLTVVDIVGEDFPSGQVTDDIFSNNTM